MVFVLVYLLLLAWLAVSQKPVKAENWLLFATTIAIAGWIGTIFGLQTDAGTSVEYARLVFALGIWSIILPAMAIVVAKSSQFSALTGFCETASHARRSRYTNTKTISKIMTLLYYV
jgi:cell division protein FtsW (lipid II flippase)